MISSRPPAVWAGRSSARRRTRTTRVSRRWSVVRDDQVELAQTRRIGDEVDGGDPLAADREAVHDACCPPSIHTAAAAPSRSAGVAPRARRENAATSAAAWISGAVPIRAAVWSALRTTSGSRRASSRSNSPLRAAARKASTSLACRSLFASGPASSRWTRRRARLASWWACSGSDPAVWPASGSGTSGPSGTSGRERRACRMFRHTRESTVVSQLARFSIESASERLSRSQASWTASSASLAEPSIRRGDRRQRGPVLLEALRQPVGVVHRSHTPVAIGLWARRAR